MVFKFGYRHEAWLGIGKTSYDESESYAFLIVMIGAGIACFVSPVLVFSGLLQPEGDDEYLKPKPSAAIATILQQTGGGAHKRVDENRELLEYLQTQVPEFLQANPWVIGWIQANDEVFVQLAAMSEDFGLCERFPKTAWFPRPWPKAPAVSPEA